MDLDSFLISLYVHIDDWWKADRDRAPRGPGRPALLAEPEVLTLAILAQWPRFRSERDFWRFADSHLRGYFPNLCTQGQLNRRIRALEPEMRELQRVLAGEIADPSAVYRLLDTTLVPAIVRVRACRKGLFCGQASFGRSASKTEWVYGFKVGLVVDPEGVVTAFGLAPATSDERPIGEALVSSDRHRAYLADKGFTGVEWERMCAEEHGALVALQPEEQLAAGVVERGSALGGRQTPDHRRGDRPAQGLLRAGAPPGEDPSGAAGSSGCQSRSLYLRTAAQCPTRPPVAPLGRFVGLKSYASNV